MLFDLFKRRRKVSITPSRNDHRYVVEEHADGKWGVYDTYTGLAAASNGKDMVSLSKRDAVEFANELNAAEKAGRKSLLL